MDGFTLNYLGGSKVITRGRQDHQSEREGVTRSRGQSDATAGKGP